MLQRLLYYGSSLFLGLVFFTAGMAKLYAEHQFPGLIGPVWLEERLAEYDLGTFARFIAFCQVIIGFTLLTLRYITLGAVMLFPMLLNILVVTISLHWQGTPYVLAVFLLINVYLLFHDRQMLLPLVTGFQREASVRSYDFCLYGHIVWLVGLAITLSALPISTYNQTFGYVFVGSGLVMAFSSAAADRMSHSSSTT